MQQSTAPGPRRFLTSSLLLSAVSAEGPIDVNMSEITMEDIHQFFSKDPSIKLGGHWKPSDCLPRWKVTGGLGSPVSLLGAAGWTILGWVVGRR